MTTLQLERVNGTFFSAFLKWNWQLWGISRQYCNDLMYVYIAKGFPLLIINASITSCSSLCVSVVRTFCQCGQLSHHGLCWIVRFYSYLKVCTLLPPSVFPASSKPRNHFSKSLTFCLFFFWDSIYGSCSVCLAYSTWHAFKVCLCCCKWQNFFFPHGWITLHHINICVYHCFIHSGQMVFHRWILPSVLQTLVMSCPQVDTCPSSHLVPLSFTWGPQCMPRVDTSLVTNLHGKLTPRK